MFDDLRALERTPLGPAEHLRLRPQQPALVTWESGGGPDEEEEGEDG